MSSQSPERCGGLHVAMYREGAFQQPCYNVHCSKCYGRLSKRNPESWYKLSELNERLEHTSTDDISNNGEVAQQPEAPEASTKLDAALPQHNSDHEISSIDSEHPRRSEAPKVLSKPSSAPKSRHVFRQSRVERIEMKCKGNMTMRCPNNLRRTLQGAKGKRMFEKYVEEVVITAKTGAVRRMSVAKLLKRVNMLKSE